MEQIQTDEWVEYELSDICKDVRYGYTASSKDEEVGPKFLRITDIVPDFIDWNEVPYCEITEKDFEKYQLEVGDIVVARTGATTGYAKRIKNPPKAVFASYLVRLKIKDEFNDEYVGYVIESDNYKEFIKKNWSGAAQPNANAKVITSYSLKVPDEETQQKVASILSAFDDLIENNNRRIEILEEMAQRIYREWFVHFRYPGHEEDELVDSGTELGEIPEGWEVKKLEDFGEIVLGKTPSTKDSANYGDYMPFIKTPDMHDQFFIHETENVLSKKGVETQGNKTIPPNSIIVNCIGAKAGVVSITAKSSQTNQQINAIVLENIQDREYLYFLLKRLRPKLRQVGSTGATMINVSKTKFKWFFALIPNREILNQFHARVCGMFDQISTLQKQNINLKEARDLLLPKLISGKIDVEEVKA